MAALTAFFEARRGRLYGFRFRDFADFKSCAPGEAVAATDQRIGVGDGVRRTFGLCKAYGDHKRRIAKPVEGSVRAAVGGVETGGFVVDHATGEVTLATARTGNVLLFRMSAGCPVKHCAILSDDDGP